MKKLPYLIGALLCVCIIIIIGNTYSNNNWNKELKGEINILSTYENYDYIKECAEEFMQSNKKVKVNIEKVYDMEYFKKAQESLGNNIDIIQLDAVSMYMLEPFSSEFKVNSDLVDTYKNNFTQGRIQETNFNGEIKGVPLSTRPLILYVREDMLKEFGYKHSDINTWDDILTIGEKIYANSNGKVRLINATGEDYEDLISLLIMQEIESGTTDEKEIVKKVNDFIKVLKEKNIINNKEGGEYAARISSINGMRELSLLEENCEWVAIYPPAKKVGENKFYVSEGSNLIIIDKHGKEDKEELVDKFISYLTTNTDIAIKYAKTGAFFPSYLYTYKDKEIEEQVKNFSLRSPLVVMSNAVEKAPKIKDYELYIKVKKVLIG